MRQAKWARNMVSWRLPKAILSMHHRGDEPWERRCSRMCNGQSRHVDTGGAFAAHSFRSPTEFEDTRCCRTRHGPD